MIKVLIAKNPVEDTWLNYPFLYEKAVKGLSKFAQVDWCSIKDESKPISANFELAPYQGIISFGGKFTEECLKKAKNLRIVSGFKCGEELLQKKGIPFIELSGGWQRSVAELGIGLTLSCLRQIALFHKRMSLGTEFWPQRQFSEDPAFVNGELYGKKVGIFGFGRIGQYYGKLVQAFGAETTAYDNKLPKEIYQQQNTTFMEIDQLIGWSDIFCICASPTPENKGIINRERIYMLKKGAILIVISRAFPLDMEAVRERVRLGEIAGGFDVYDVEPLPSDDPLRLSPNVTLTPHIGGRCADSNRMMADIIVEAFRKELINEN